MLHLFLCTAQEKGDVLAYLLTVKK